MKNFIKISLIALALMLTTSANAKLIPVSLGIKGGINSSTVNTKGWESKSGFNAGLTLDVNLPANLAIMSGLEISTKGAKMSGSQLDIPGMGTVDVPSSKINATYLQLPVHLGYRIKLIPGLRLHVNAGPYFSQGIGGKTNFELVGADGQTTKAKTFKDDVFEKFDWGLGIGAGATVLGMVQVRAGYDWGMKNVSKIDGMNIKNRNFYASVGFLIF